MILIIILRKILLRLDKSLETLLLGSFIDSLSYGDSVIFYYQYLNVVNS